MNTSNTTFQNYFRNSVFLIDSQASCFGLVSYAAYASSQVKLCIYSQVKGV